jgi:hypothetical protein
MQEKLGCFLVQSSVEFVTAESMDTARTTRLARASRQRIVSRSQAVFKLEEEFSADSYSTRLSIKDEDSERFLSFFERTLTFRVEITRLVTKNKQRR